VLQTSGPIKASAALVRSLDRHQLREAGEGSTHLFGLRIGTSLGADRPIAAAVMSVSSVLQLK
jgi:hypothetical protein